MVDKKKKSLIQSLLPVPLAKKEEQTYGPSPLLGKMDAAFVGIKMPNRSILKKYFGMVITSMSREKQASNYESNHEILTIELDGYLNLQIEVKNGICTIQSLPTGSPRMSTVDKVEYIMKNEVRE